MTANLEIRNTLGRIVSDLLAGAVGAPYMFDSGHETVISQRMIEVARENGDRVPQRAMRDAYDYADRLRGIIDPISGATALAVAPEALPEMRTLPGVDWVRMPAPMMWVDFTAPMTEGAPLKSLFIFDATEFGWAIKGVMQDGGAIRRQICAFIFGHGKHRDYRRFNGHRWVTGIDGPLVWLNVPEDGSNGLDLGSSDFLGIELDSARLWREQGAKENWLRASAASALAVLFACNVVSNLELVKVAPARRVPKSEQNLPRFEYRVLKIRSKGQNVSSPSLEEQLRKSPRQHLRRGHLRHLKSGTVTWVRPAIIGNPDLGHILHDYLL